MGFSRNSQRALSRRNFLKMAGAGALALTAGRIPAAPPASSSHPNIVFILADDFGWADVAFNGNTFYETPNLDRLAASGMRFSQAYAACAVCSPTRASIQTGKYPARLGITDWIPGSKPANPKLLCQPTKIELPLAERTIAEALRDGGYHTAFIGKWHLGDRGFLPQDQGYETNVAGGKYGQPPKGYFAPYEIEGLPEGPTGEYLTDRLTTEAEHRLESLARTPERPFALFFCHYTVHMPIQPRTDLLAHYQDKQSQKGVDAHWKRPDYAAMVDSLDKSVGRVLATLDRLGQAQNTIVFFMSDNGGVDFAGGVTSNFPLRSGKGHYYEGGIREPLLVRWPGVTQPGSRCDTPVISTDFYPTMLEMAGLPLEPKNHPDGLSLVPLLKAPSTTLSREALYWHYPHYHGSGATPCGTIRAGEFKLIESFEDNHVELYNIKNDLSEEHDLASEMPAKAAELLAKLRQWRTDVGALMPKPNPNYDPTQPATQKKKAAAKKNGQGKGKKARKKAEI